MEREEPSLYLRLLQEETIYTLIVMFGFRRNPDIAKERRGRAEVGPAVVIDYQ